MKNSLIPINFRHFPLYLKKIGLGPALPPIYA